MSVPALPAFPVKLPWWTFVKDSYADAWRDAPAFLKAGSLCLFLQILLLFFSPHAPAQDVNAFLNRFAGQLNSLADATPERLASLLSFPGSLFDFKDALLNTLENGSLAGIAFLLWLPMRTTFYRRYLQQAPIGFVNPLALGKTEWTLTWETLNVFWYLILPSFAFVVGLTILSILGSLLTLLLDAWAMLLVLPLVLFVGLYLLVWILTRFTVLTCALAGVVENPRLRMWNDMWRKSKMHHNAILMGITFVPPELLLSMAQGVSQKMPGQGPLLLFLETSLVMMAWLVLSLARAAFEARCYAFIKAQLQPD